MNFLRHSSESRYIILDDFHRIQIQEIVASIVETPSGIREQFDSKISVLTEGFQKMKDLDFVVLGGSVAENMSGWWSDVDVFVSMPHYTSYSPEHKISAFNQLHGLLYDTTKFENIEIEIIEQVPISVRFSTIQKGILLYERKSGLYNEFKYCTMRNYYDYKMWIDRFHHYREGN